MRKVGRPAEHSAEIASAHQSTLRRVYGELAPSTAVHAPRLMPLTLTRHLQPVLSSVLDEFLESG
jgi:hypothetical protein